MVTEDTQKQEWIQEFHTLLSTFMVKVKTKQPNHDFGLADGQIYLLYLLRRRGSCKATDIANEIGITSGAVTAMTDKMVNLGLIERARTEEDRRVVQLFLTEKGKEKLDEIHAMRIQYISHFFSQLSVGELEDIVNVFRKLHAILDEGTSEEEQK